MVALPNKVIDIHTHILPGIDDGARTFEDSINIIKWLVSQGITDIIATPHYVDETDYVSPKSQNQKLLSILSKKLQELGISVNLYLGNEIYIDSKIPELIKTGKISPLAGGKYLLIELPLDTKFPNYEDYFAELLEKGYKVILAHPERYLIVQDNFEVVRKISDMGVLLQCNTGSIIGKYGRKAEKIVKKLAKEKMIFALGTDTHHAGREDYFLKAFKKFAHYYGEGGMKQLLMTNPGKIIKSGLEK